jgi:hypothetical protein
MRIATVVLCTLAAAPAYAQVYTFDAPNFTYLQQLPLLNRAPNTSGPYAGLTSSFTMLQGSMFVIDTTHSDPLNGLMSGQYLATPQGAQVLQIQFSQPVSMVSFDFALNGNISGFNLSCQTDTTTLIPAIPVSGGGQGAWGGHAALTGPISSITISALNPSQQMVAFAIDTLAVPAPGTGAALCVAGAALLRRRRA